MLIAKIHPLSFSMKKLLGNILLVCFPVCSLSLSLLWEVSSLHTAAPMLHFSPKSCLQASYLLWCGLFSSFSCSLFCQCSGQFLGYLWWFDSCLVGFMGQGEMTRVLLPCSHFPLFQIRHFYSLSKTREVMPAYWFYFTSERGKNVLSKIIFNMNSLISEKWQSLLSWLRISLLLQIQPHINHFMMDYDYRILKKPWTTRSKK